MPNQVSLLFEVQDLATASPSSISRAGMIYNDYKDLGWRPYVDSWLQKYSAKSDFIDEVRDTFLKLIENYRHDPVKRNNSITFQLDESAVRESCQCHSKI